MNTFFKRLAFAGAVGMSSLSMAAPAYTQCPAFGADTGCAVLITINPDLTLTFSADADQGPYDGVEDTLIGVVNNSGASASGFNLASTTDIFGFEGDGIVAYGAPGNAKDPSGYGGPLTYFTNIAANFMSGTVNFNGGLGAGASTYFSLEENLSGPNGTVGGGLSGGGVVPGVPEPSTYALMALGLAGIATIARRRRSAE